MVRGNFGVRLGFLPLTAPAPWSPVVIDPEVEEGLPEGGVEV